jgi:ketosteroid isomerase-like protein
VRATEDFREAWAEIQAEPIELIEDGDAVVAVFRFSLTSRAGVSLETEEGWAYWLSDGRIHRIEQHATREAALEAAGIEPPDSGNP